MYDGNISGCLTLTTAGDACTFPFTYKGTEYNECTSIANNGVPWCTTAMGWGNCEKSCTTTGERNLFRLISSVSDKNISGCLTLTTDGDACTFPFTYKGKEYFECTSIANNGVPWCGTSTAKGWGICEKSCEGDIDLICLFRCNCISWA